MSENPDAETLLNREQLRLEVALRLKGFQLSSSKDWIHIPWEIAAIRIHFTRHEKGVGCASAVLWPSTQLELEDLTGILRDLDATTQERAAIIESAIGVHIALKPVQFTEKLDIPFFMRGIDALAHAIRCLGRAMDENANTEEFS